MSLIVDIAILALLIGTLGYAFMVDRRVRKMMQALQDLEPLIGSFSEAVDRSESAVTVLKSLGQTVQAPFGSRRGSREEPPATRGEGAFRSSREPARGSRSSGGIPVKSELVRGFFETVRSREA
ncbi:flagellar motor switch protein [Pseudooceanicola sp. LIPI14-2-Ac024]|uniref:flagellar motor switch protein n=1 Tax=Pseudooceanicola sp. LIPI14-2-Ac024 TaxID=3344875 RepID=UPI0035D12569